MLSTVHAEAPWAFLAIAATAKGAPRWLFLDGAQLDPLVALDDIASCLRRRLAGDPLGVALDHALPWLERVLDAAAKAEHLLLPRRMQRALEQLGRVTATYALGMQRQGDEGAAMRWRRLGELADVMRTDRRPDPYSVAERWLEVVRPRLDAERARRRHQPFVLLRDIERNLEAEPLVLDEVEAGFGALVTMAPVDERVVACILGVSAPPHPRPATSSRFGGSR